MKLISSTSGNLKLRHQAPDAEVDGREKVNGRQSVLLSGDDDDDDIIRWESNYWSWSLLIIMNEGQN